MNNTVEVPSPMEMLSSGVRQIITEAIIRSPHQTPVILTLTPPAVVSALPTRGPVRDQPQPQVSCIQNQTLGFTSQRSSSNLPHLSKWQFQTSQIQATRPGILLVVLPWRRNIQLPACSATSIFKTIGI